MKLLKFTIIFCIFFAACSTSKAQLTIEIKSLDGGAVIDFSYPFYSTYLRVKQKGANIVLAKDQVFFREPAYDIFAAEVGTPDADGFQRVKWVTRDLKTSGELSYFTQVLVDYNGDAASAVIGGIARYRPNLFFTNDNDQQIIDMNFGNVPPPQSFISQLRIYGWISHLNDQNKPDEVKLTLNSITKSKPELTLEWQGSDTDPNRKAPPRTLLTGSRYWINIDFNPVTANIFNDYVVFTMDSVVKAAIPIMANYYSISGESALKMITPAGDEKVTPCEDFRLSWKGNSTDLPSDIYYSVDNGNSWQYITSSKDSQFLWQVPAVNTDSARIQIRQRFQKTSTRLLREELTSVNTSAFNKNGGRLLSVNNQGKALEWELIQNPDPFVFQRFYLSPDTVDYYTVVSSCYTNDNDHFAVYFASRNPFGVFEYKLALFDRNVSKFPFKTINLPDGFIAKKMIINNDGTILGFCPSAGSKIQLLNSSDGTLIKYIQFNSPVDDFSFANSTPFSLVSLFGGELRILNNSDFTTQKTINLTYEPTINNVALSPNGKLIAVSTVNPNSASYKNSVYIVSAELGQIVRRYRVSAGNTLGLYFNPTSTSLVVGSQTPEQVAVINLLEPNTVDFLDNHSDRLTSIAISPNGHAIATTSIGADNLFYRTFSYPEQATSNTFSIKYAVTDKDKFVVPEAYYGSTGNLSAQSLCNKSDVFLDISDVKIVPGENFDLASSWVRDTILPGKCSDFNFVYHPRDTGIVHDTAVLYTCTRTIRMPIEAYSRPRNFSYPNDGYNFGDVCVGDTLDVPLSVLTNNDPVPVKINYLIEDPESDGTFMIADQNRDTTLQPGGTLKATLRFVPKKLGNFSGKILVYYADLTKIIGEFNVKGNGIGTFVESSHDTLLFIPEVLTRTLKIKNIGDQNINFEGFEIIPPDHYKVLTKYPFDLPKGETKDIDISWDGIANTGAALRIDANPCLVQKFIYLGQYSAKVNLSIIDTNSLPTNKDAVIPIEYSFEENGPYKGVRPFIADIKLDGTLFLPQSVSSAFGTARIISNKFDTDGRTRIFKIQIDGDFSSSGRLAEIHGFAGLSDTNQTAVIFEPNSQFFGKAVNNLFNSGIFSIIGVPNGGYIDRQPVLTINSISPNPANSNIRVDFTTETGGEATIRIFDNLGEIVGTVSMDAAPGGGNQVSMDLKGLSPGTYTVSLSGNTGKDTRLLIILR